ncbi:MAG: nucleotidyltransferase family protein [Alphaproteobacteria bacterium]
MRPEHCALIVLASGLSERFGAENKLLADLDGKPLIKHVTDEVSPLAFQHKIAVIPDEPALDSLLCSAGYQCVINRHPSRGQNSSRTIGIKTALAHSCEAALIMLGDMPFIAAPHIVGLLKAGKTHDAVFSSCGDVRMPPAFFKGAALRQLAQEQTSKNRLFEFCEIVPISSEAARDIDTLADLADAARLT